MKVYVVVADNQEIEDIFHKWNDSVFLSKEAAEKYIQSQPVIFYGEQTRIEQLDELSNERELDEDEMREYEYLNNRWKFCWHYPPHYEIEEFDAYE